MSAFFLIFSLLAPLTMFMPAAAAPASESAPEQSAAARRDGAPPPLPTPNRVVVAGDFQDDVGCPGDWDKTCDITALANNGDGSWSGSFQIPAGSYSYRIVTSSDIDRSLGEDGDPDGSDLSLQVPDDAVAVYFSYNALTGAIVAEPSSNQVVLATDVGQFIMAPAGGGNYEVYFDAPGTVGVQTIVDDQPVGGGQVDGGNSGRAHVVADSGGNVVEAESVDTGELVVTKSDEGGNPQPGACFAAYDGNDVLSQDCDFNDGSDDGTTVLRFPNGIPGSADIEETFTPDGQEEADGQDVDLGPGQNSIQMIVGGGGQPQDDEETPPDDEETPPDDEETPPDDEETPPDDEEQPPQGAVEVALFSVDENGNLIPFACYSIDGGNEVCDDDGDGVTVLETTPGSHSITETTAPDGYEGFGSFDVDVPEGGDQFQVPHTASSGPPDDEETPPDDEETPEDEETPPDEGDGFGTLTVYTDDQNGNPVPNVCYDVSNLGQQCDEDGDGDMGLTDVPAGDYTVQQIQVPDGYQVASDDEEQATVDDGQDTEVRFTSEQTVAETGGFIIHVRDQDGNPVADSCWELRPRPGTTAPVVNRCDADDGNNDGDVDFGEVAVGRYRLDQTSNAEGAEPARRRNVEITAGETTELDLQNNVAGQEQPETPEISETPETPAQEFGTLTAFTDDADGNPVGNVCYQISSVDDPNLDAPEILGQQCDEDGDGDMALTDVPVGAYLVEQIQVPDDFELADEPQQQVAVEAGAGAEVRFTSASSAPEAGSLRITIQDENGDAVSNACVVVSGPQQGQLCDNQDPDADSADGSILLPNLQPGDYDVSQDEAPEGFQAAGTESVAVQAGEEAAVTLVLPPAAAPTGSVTVTTENSDGEPIGPACYRLDGPQSYQICDGDEDDAAGDDGQVGFDDVEVGEYTVTQESTAENYQTAEPQSMTVEDGETAEVTFENAAALGSLIAFTTDQNGNPVPGVCYDVTDNDVTCDQDGDGDMGLIDIPVGDYTVRQESVPDGYELADEQEQETTVTAGGTAEVRFTSELQSGTIRIFKTDGADSLEGACFTVDGGGEVCDNGDGDANDDDGVIEIENVAPGQHTVAESQAPENYQGAADQTVEVPAGGAGEVTFINTLEPGSIDVAVTDESTGEPVPGACIAYNGPESGEVCDEDGTDTDDAAGRVRIPDLPPGEYEVSVSDVPEGFEGEVTEEASVQPGQEEVIEAALLPVPTPTEEPTETPTEEPTATEEPTETPTEEPTATEEPTETPTEEPTATEEPTVTEEATETPTEEASPTEEPTEEATATGEPTEEASPTGEPTEEPTAEPATGSIEVAKTDGDGNPLPASCFALSGPSEVGPVCDNESGDENDGEGVILITGIAAGDYSLTETQAPDGFTAGADQDVTIPDDGSTVPVTVVNTAEAPATGGVRILSQDQDGNPAGGSCYTIDGLTVCDNGEGDSDPAPGVIALGGLDVGEYDVEESTPPSGFLQAETQSVEIPADDVAEVVFEHEAAPPETGSVQFELQDDQGNPAPDSCVTLSSEANQGGEQEYCDGGDEDSDPAPGVLLVEDLPVATYSVKQSDAPADPQAFVAASVAEKTVTVQANIIIIVIIIIIIDLPDEGDLLIVKKAADTNQLLADACFQVSGDSGDVEICDNDGADGHGSEGLIRFEDLPLGDYELTETTPPTGYQAVDPQTVTVGVGVEVIEVDDEPIVETTGNLTVFKVDGNADPLESSCFALRSGNVVIAGPICDDDDGANDGTITFTDIDAGNYTLRETQAPSSDYFFAADRQVEIASGETEEVSVVNELKPGRVQVYKENEGGERLGGSCFLLDGPDDNDYEVCDNETGDSNPAIGTIRFTNIAAGTYDLVETVAPVDYDPADDQEIEVQPNATTFVTVVNEETPEPPQKGNVTIHKVDENDDPLPGACFVLKQGQVTKVGQRCDGDDGANDGTITFTGVGVGAYAIHESKKPSADYQTVAPVNIQVQNNQTATVTIENVLKPGRVLIKKVNQQGHPIQNACFDLSPDGKGPKCTDANGQIVFDNLDPTIVYKTREVVVPPGYQKAPDKTNIVVHPGLTTVVTIVDKKAPPPADTGSIKVIKFYCPAGKGGELTQIIDSSNAGPKKLTKTAGCTKGNATFTLELASGQGDPVQFTTGADGEYQATLPKGTYTLTETSPQLPGDRTEDVVIYVGQQTTVVVLNFVKPPEPAPATINVTKYTCDPGFEGVYYADFLSNCADASTLTNNVTFRIAGAATGKHITGDTGQKGKTRFTQLPAGNYTLKEEAPSSAATVYGFCGFDQNNPSLKTLGTNINFTLQAGNTIHCTYFNVPDDLSDTTGAILVHKYVCDATKYPANFDWENECSPQTGGVKFTLSVWNGEKFVPKSTGLSNDDGLVRFSQLRPGTYQLKEVGSNWCHAESDNVKADGNLVVRAGQRTNVWIYNCVPTKNPPNTGAGTTAGTPPPSASAPSAPGPADTAMLFGLSWPLLGLAAYGWRRRRAA